MQRKTIRETPDGEPRSTSKIESSVLELVDRENKPESEKNKIDVCFGYFSEFTNNTSLHGLKYIGERRPIVEKVWWMVMFVLCMFACANLIFKIWEKWEQNPVIISFAETSTPVWQIPFPAVTVCPGNKARKTIYNFTDNFHKYKNKQLSDAEVLDYESASLVCKNHDIRNEKNFTNHHTIDFLSKIAHRPDELLQICKWKNVEVSCGEIFTRVLTEEGVCFSFNMLNAQELFRKEMLNPKYIYPNHEVTSDGWTLADGYTENLPYFTYPYRGTVGSKTGLSLVFGVHDSDIDYLCRGSASGFKLSLSTPSEIPRTGSQYFRLLLSQQANVMVKPNMMTTSQSLRNINPKRRQCYFQAERKLKFFQTYSQINCEMECLANYTTLLCGCVPFYLYIINDRSVPICSTQRTVCVREASVDLQLKGFNKTDFRKSEFEFEEWQNKGEEMDELAQKCNCLPACTSIKYAVEISRNDFDWKKLMSAYDKNLSEYEDFNMARIDIFFIDSEFVASQRSELYGQTDFLANCGGLLGLCLGFSILSLVEIIYFVTLRAFCYMKKTKNNEIEDSGNINQVDEHTTNHL